MTHIPSICQYEEKENERAAAGIYEMRVFDIFLSEGEILNAAKLTEGTSIAQLGELYDSPSGGTKKEIIILKLW